MSSLQQLLMDLADDLYTPYYGSDFGLGLNPHIFHQQHPGLFRLPLALSDRGDGSAGMMRRSRRGGRKSAVSNVGKDGFQVCMDVEHFKPNELSVKVIDNSVVVEGQHEEKEDEHGFISRRFVRRYTIPKNYDPEKLVSTLSSDGVLTVSIPKPAIEEKPNEKIIQIQQTGPAHLNIKNNQQESSSKHCEGGDAQNGK